MQQLLKLSTSDEMPFSVENLHAISRKGLQPAEIRLFLNQAYLCTEST